MFRSLIVASVAVAVAASAAQASDFQFRYASWELESAGGRAAVMDRITDKAERVCSSLSYIALYKESAVSRCEAGVTRELVDRIGDPRLAAMSSARFASN